jgi:excisionase family DNA binding protein
MMLRPKYMTRFEAADYIRNSVATVDRAVRQKKLRPYRIGRRVLFSAEALDAFVRGDDAPGDDTGEAVTSEAIEAGFETSVASVQTAD